MTFQGEPNDSNSPPAGRSANLIEDVTPFARGRDDIGLLALLRRDWSVGELAGLLHGDGIETAVTAARCLGLIGGPGVTMPLARALYHDDARVVAAAEDALWRTWFDAGGAYGRRRLSRAADEMDAGRHRAATVILDDVIAHKPDFAEAFNQRAIARYLQDDFVGSIADCKRATALNRCHFGAMAGMGHGHAHLGQYGEAVECYQMALRIHPRMAGVRQSIRKIQGLPASSRPVA